MNDGTRNNMRYLSRTLYLKNHICKNLVSEMRMSIFTLLDEKTFDPEDQLIYLDFLLIQIYLYFRFLICSLFSSFI